MSYVTSKVCPFHVCNLRNALLYIPFFPGHIYKPHFKKWMCCCVEFRSQWPYIGVEWESKKYQ